MVTLTDWLVALPILLVGGATIHRYWQLVDLDHRDDPLPDPVLMALLPPGPGPAPAANGNC